MDVSVNPESVVYPPNPAFPGAPVDVTHDPHRDGDPGGSKTTTFPTGLPVGPEVTTMESLPQLADDDDDDDDDE